MTSFLEREPSERAAAEPEFNLRDYIGIVLEGWPWIAAFAFLGLLWGLYAAWKQPPVYQAEALVRLESQKQGGGGGASAAMMAENFGPPSTVPAESIILRSRSILGAAAERINLRVNASPDYWGNLGKALAHWRNGNSPRQPPFGLLDSYAWGGETIRVSQLRLPSEVTSAGFHLVAGAEGTYELRTRGGETILEGVVDEAAEGNAPGIGKVEILVDTLHARPGTRFNVGYRNRDAAIGSLRRRFSVREAGRSSGMLSLTVNAESPADAERQLDAIMAVYLEKNVERQSEEASRQLEFLKEQLPQIKNRRDNAEQRLRDFQQNRGLLDLSTEAQSLLTRLSEADRALEELQFQREELLRRYTPEHPSVEAVDAKIATLRQERQELQSEVRGLPEAQSQLLELQREVQVTNELYRQLLNRAQELEIARAGITGFVHIVDEAHSSGGMVAPQRTQITALYLLMGLVLGAVVVVLRNIFRTALREPDQLESRSGLPVYATVPYSDSERKLHDEHAMPLAAVEPEDLAVESLRSLRTSLQFALTQSGTGHCVAFTGPTPSCGKSFVSANMAVLLAQAGKSVALVEGDLRRGRLRRNFDIPRRHPGLSECLSGQAALDEALVQKAGIHVLASGVRPPNPAELLMSPIMSDLLGQLRDRFDYVLLDLPPVLNVADSSILASYADALFMVVRSEMSTMHDVQQAQKRLMRDDIEVKGIVFNAFKPSRLRYGYSRYGYYSYRYRSERSR